MLIRRALVDPQEPFGVRTNEWLLPGVQQLPARGRIKAARRCISSSGVSIRLTLPPPPGLTLSYHAPGVARGAHAAPLAREGDQEVVLTRLTESAGETVGEDPAFEVTAELPLHIRG